MQQSYALQLCSVHKTKVVSGGGTYWLQQGLSLGLRIGWFTRDEEAQDQNFGHRSMFLTGRLSL